MVLLIHIASLECEKLLSSFSVRAGRCASSLNEYGPAITLTNTLANIDLNPLAVKKGSALPVKFKPFKPKFALFHSVVWQVGTGEALSVEKPLNARQMGVGLETAAGGFAAAPTMGTLLKFVGLRELIERQLRCADARR